VLVGIMTHEIARSTAFWRDLMNLELPDGALSVAQIGASIPFNCNELCRVLLRTDAEALWMIGDDHTFAPDLLKNLLARDVDIVAPLCLKHQIPYTPTAYTDFVEGHPRERKHLHLPTLLRTGLIRIHSCGAAGMLIRREVIEALEDPWFDGSQEDLYFCDRAREAGFDLHLDLDNPLGHAAMTHVWPIHTPEGWTFAFRFGDGFQLEMPVGAWRGEPVPA
jgi:hypothetical protein